MCVYTCIIVATNELRVCLCVCVCVAQAVSEVASNFLKYSSGKHLMLMRKPIHFRTTDLYYNGSNWVIVFVGSNNIPGPALANVASKHPLIRSHEHIYHARKNICEHPKQDTTIGYPGTRIFIGYLAVFWCCCCRPTAELSGVTPRTCFVVQIFSSN